MKNKKGFWALNIGLLYILPWLVGFILFKVYPFLSSLFYSFTNYDLFNGITKYGMMNYEKIFTDPDIIRAFVVTFKYAIFDVPLKLMFALFIAYILNFKLKGVNFFRTAYYIPSILGGSIAIAILWRAVFNTDGLDQHRFRRVRYPGDQLDGRRHERPDGDRTSPCMAVRFRYGYLPGSLKGRV